MEFKDYKEKQQYYKERAKQQRNFFISTPPTYNRPKGAIVKGETYIKSKESDKND